MRQIAAQLCWLVSVLGLMLSVLMAQPADLRAASPTCKCQATAAGGCRRWQQNAIHYSLYAPADTPGGLSNSSVEHAVKKAFADWESIQCEVCSVAGADGCEPSPCPANPFGVAFAYDGLAAKAQLASSCQGKMPCDGAAAGTTQVAFLRSDAQWPMGTFLVSTTFVTATKSGQIIDADILLRDSTHVFCVDNCAGSQYSLHAAMLREIGHLLGMGAVDEVESMAAANFKAGTDLPDWLPNVEAQCACQVYRTTSDLSTCTSPTETPVACTASKNGAAPIRDLRAGWLVGAVGLAGILWWRRQRFKAP